ncbi:MAG: threonylcarbamoyl-AMP synthase, partial [Gammaproteobacteria bacterium]|nr:threonylcarbamoyl-AMP synthase [Gammaproteobacteria bacterium]
LYPQSKMPTVTELLDASLPQDLERASQLLAAGEVVAFPTETVYGLGADGLNAEAVRKIFQAKGRPADNPLILHVCTIEQALPLWRAEARQIELAQKLADVFWPGPLSLVLPAAPLVPKEVTAGLDSVAVRAPAGTAARELLALCQFPLAAPSANLSGRPSPTNAAHVAATLEGKIAAILDGGQTSVGIESTVLDLRSEIPRILRPGHISAEAIAQVVGEVDGEVIGELAGELAGEVTTELEINGPGHNAPSPGLRHRHYQPAGMLLSLVDKEALETVWDQDVAIICRETTAGRMGKRNAPLISLPGDARGYAAGFYGALYTMEGSGASELVIEKVPDTPEWAAVNDRLRRAVQS